VLRKKGKPFHMERMSKKPDDPVDSRQRAPLWKCPMKGRQEVALSCIHQSVALSGPPKHGGRSIPALVQIQTVATIRPNKRKAPR